MKWLSVIRRRKRFCNRPQFFIDRHASPRRPRTDYVVYLIRLRFFLFFFPKLRDGKIAFLTTTPRAVRTARCVVCKEGNIWMRSCVRAVRKSVSALFSLLVFLTFSVFHFLTCSLAHFFVSHFLICLLFTSSLANFFVSHFPSCSLSTSSLANFLTFFFSELSANRWEWVVGRLRNAANTKAAIEESERKRA